MILPVPYEIEPKWQSLFEISSNASLLWTCSLLILRIMSKFRAGFMKVLHTRAQLGRNRSSQARERKQAAISVPKCEVNTLGLEKQNTHRKGMPARFQNRCNSNRTEMVHFAFQLLNAETYFQSFLYGAENITVRWNSSPRPIKLIERLILSYFAHMKSAGMH